MLSNPGANTLQTKHQQRGFTLIELLIVLFIIGLLAAIALPIYQAFSTRAKLAEGITLARGLSTDITMHWSSQGEFPNAAEIAELASTQGSGGQYVKNLSLAPNGQITVHFKEDSGVFGTLVFSPNPQSATLNWRCTSPDINPTLLPGNCRDE